MVMQCESFCMSLTTDFVCIGRSGKTVDGREIEPQWLLDAAESYSPTTYTAMIWPEHFRWWNSGTVVELKAEEDGDDVALFARLHPNSQLIQANKEGQRLFTSMELDTDFAGTGKCYLVGLGVTDSPASLGTDQLKFSARTKNSQLFSGVELGSLEEDEPPTWFTKFFSGWGQQPPAHKKESTVEAKKFEDLSAQVAKLSETVAALGEKFSQQQAPAEQPAPAPEPEEKKDTAVDTSALFTKLEDMNKSIVSLTNRLEQPRPGTPASETPSPADDFHGVI